jgi:PAS domain S-box-containing protein
MRPPSSSTKSRRYTVAVAATVATLLMRIGIDPWAGTTSPHLFFAPAVMLAAWFGGFGPGMLSTIAGAILANYFLMDPSGEFSFDNSNVIRSVVFLLVGWQISWLSGAMHAAQLRAEADAHAARRSEKLYRTLAANFPDGFVCLFDRDLHWTLVAGAGLTAAGLVREQMEGRTIAESLPTASADQVTPLCQSAVDGRSARAEINHGENVYFCHALPLRPEDEGTHVGMIILEDITDRARARQALQWAHDNLEQRVRERTAELHFQTTLLESQSEASADGILALGNDGRVIFANDRFASMWSLATPLTHEPADSLRSRMREQLQVHLQDPLSASRDEMAVREPEGTVELPLADGRIIERYSSPIVDPQGTSYGRVWFFRDVTDRNRLQRQVLEVAEGERQRIGQDLHDDLCQQLTGIACLGQALQQQLTDASAASAANEIVERVQQANQRARDLARGLQPVNLQRDGLAMALQGLCASIQNVFHVTCRFAAQDVPDDIDETAAIQLYRITQEAISNAVRHGKAQRVVVDLIAIESRMILTIEDNGVGISQPLPEGGMGLHTMNYRARLIGGTLTIGRGQPGGTVVTCSVPLRVPALAVEREMKV